MPQDYLLADQPSELERLRLQSLVWEPTGRQLLRQLENGAGGRALDVGCGALGWLRILSEWVGPSGRVVDSDIDESLLNVARSSLEGEGISNAELARCGRSSSSATARRGNRSCPMRRPAPPPRRWWRSPRRAWIAG